MLTTVAKRNNVGIAVTKRVVKSHTWNSYAALLPQVKGAFFCLDRDEINPNDNIAKDYKVGWDYAMWYAFTKAAKSKPDSGAELLTINRVAKLSQGTAEVWSNQETGADLLRLSNTIRHLANTSCERVGNIQRFLKKRGWFVEHFCGKKPIAGIYTDTELQVLDRAWTEKISDIQSRFDSIAEGTVYTVCKPLVHGIQDLLSGFVIARSDRIKKIEAAASARIPELLVKAGKGKDKKDVITKGGSLAEKLISINGGNTVRTIGKVLWSPEYLGFNRTQFAEHAMAQARSLHLREPNNYLARETERLSAAGQNPTNLQCWRDVIPHFNQAAQIYLEAIQENQGNASWDAAFGVTPRH
jgi:hypothetical protein